MTIPDITDETMPDGRWKFDQDVTDVFDNMLERSIPQYETMRSAVVDLLSTLGGETTHVLDLGTSNGIMLDRIMDAYGDAGRYVGTDVSVEMLHAARKRLTIDRDGTNVTLLRHDLRDGFPTILDGEPFDAILSILTLQFVPIEYRERIVADAYEALDPGGVLIVVEKVLGSGALLDGAMVDVYLNMKRRNGYTDEQIDRKRLSLEGVLVPLTADWNVDLLRTAGFSTVDCFWRWMNFAGWIAVK